MKRVLVGVIIGLALGGGLAIAAGSISVPAGAVATLRDPGSRHGTLLRFQHFDVNCVYLRSSAPPPEENLTNEPTLACGRASNWNGSRRLMITPYRIFVWNASGSVVYRATRTP